MSQNSLKFLHDIKQKTIKDGVKVTHEEFVIHGPKGLTIKYYHKDDKNTIKIVIYEKDGKYMMKMTDGDKKEEKELSKAELLKELKSNNLDFALDYVKKSGGAKKVSKKASKKASKKKYSKK